MQSKKILIISVIILASIGIIILILRFSTPEDNWICKNGSWQKHGAPSAPMPTELCK
jgi:hypothetical protein